MHHQLIMEYINKLLIADILSKIPENKKPVHYLMDLLGLSIESAYRRIRGEIPFTFNEITKLSLSLGFSVDKLINKDKSDNAYFDMMVDKDAERSEVFYQILVQYDNHVQNLYNAKKTASIMSWSHLPPIFQIWYDNIFRFTYYKWLHQANEIPSNLNFSEIIVPDKIKLIQNKLKEYMRSNNNNLFIIGPHMFLNLINEIKYYYRRKLISNKELVLLKDDVRHLIDLLESIVREGVYDEKAKSDFYLSTLEIESNNSYISYDGNEVCYFWVYSLPPLSIRNPDVCAIQKKWLESLKKYSVLITKSNEILQTEYFFKQYEYLDLLKVGSK